MKTMIVVTHLLGTGHLARALTLARAFTAAGHGCTVVSGGLHAPHLDATGVNLVHLPPLRSDGVNFTRLLDDSGTPTTDTYMYKRRHVLERTLVELAPDAIVTELFPFGRRILRDEFVHLLTSARRLPVRPVVCASVRDILAPPSKPAKAAATEDIIRTHYDAVLVHSDAQIMPLEASWPVSPALANELYYTGFVAPGAAGGHPKEAGKGEILVSAGGGDVGDHLFDEAVGAAAAQPSWRWRILVGGQDAAKRVARLRSRAPDNVIAETARPDFRQMLHHARASVSMCGYNTALDILQAGTAAVFVPFDAGGEVEQSLRAKALARLPGVALLPTSDLSKDTLLRALKEVMNAPERPTQTAKFDGARETVRIVETLRERRA
ncbi:glycosyltransferase [Roseobacter sp. YSTF-M11]|uniref:Glycosyltransferase n=1 Tax=Roseobacter insulae TaxID=2859783 RepID=A0A9X1JXE2_9RHOB|nr:glycosyltransferase [Roseobacter insulae]MBW4707130.1 glycosyltransferase [Roseobacter insulae]